MGYSYDQTLFVNSCMWTVWKEKMCRCEFNIQPCHKGTTSLVFHGSAWSKDGQKEKVVVKVSRNCCRQEGVWDPYLTTKRECTRLANKFNSWMRGHSTITYTVEFVSSKTVDLDEHSLLTSRLCKKRFTDGEVVLIEERLPTVRTFLDEHGRTNEDLDMPQKVVNAFCHYVYKEMRGCLAISSLKGYICNSRLIFNIPTLHSNGSRYGKGDKGSHGIKVVWGNHACSDICPSSKLVPTAPNLKDDYLLSSDFIPND